MRFAGRHHDRLLYRKTRAPNPLVGACEPHGELVLDALSLLLELDEPFTSLPLGELVPPPDGVAERPQCRAALDADRIEPRPRAPATGPGTVSTAGGSPTKAPQLEQKRAPAASSSPHSGHTLSGIGDAFTVGLFPAVQGS
jgi:hypothetical protein